MYVRDSRHSKIVSIFTLLILGVIISFSNIVSNLHAAEPPLDPAGLATDKSGNVFVADSGNHHIVKFTNIGSFIRSWGGVGFGNGQFNLPLGVATDSSGNVFVADSANNRIQKFSTTGTFIRKWGFTGTGNGQFNIPYGVAVDSSGNVFVADRSNDRVQKFSSTGTFIRKWTYSAERTMDPVGLATDKSGNVFVADAANNRIIKFSGTGTFIRSWGGLGTGDGQFKFPLGVATDSSGNVFVVDKDNNRVHNLVTQVFLLKSGVHQVQVMGNFNHLGASQSIHQEVSSLLIA